MSCKRFLSFLLINQLSENKLKWKQINYFWQKIKKIQQYLIANSRMMLYIFKIFSYFQWKLYLSISSTRSNKKNIKTKNEKSSKKIIHFLKKKLIDQTFEGKDCETSLILKIYFNPMFFLKIPNNLFSIIIKINQNSLW